MIKGQYSTIRAKLAEGTPATLLHIGAEQTVVIRGHLPDSSEQLTLAIGAEKTAREFFRHEPPTLGEIENAIMHVEDEIARARAKIPRHSALFSMDAGIREIAQLADKRDQAQGILSLEAMERIFDRLAALAQGHPASQAGLPASNIFAARLLILREFMHHLQFEAITLPKDWC